MIVLADGADGQDLLDHQALRDDRLELVEDHVDGVDFTIGVAVDDVFGDGLDVAELRHLENAQVLAGDAHRRGAQLIGSLRGIAAAEVVAALAAHALHVDVDAGLGIDEALRGLEQVGVEAAGQAAVAGDDDEDDVALLARLQQRMLGRAGLRIDDVGALRPAI